MNFPAPEPTTQQLLDNLDVVAFYSAQIPGFKPNGSQNVKCNCPFHGGDGLSINAESGLWNCHSTTCSKSGSPWGFLEEKGCGPAQIRSTLLDYQRVGTFGSSANARRETKAKSAPGEKEDLGAETAHYDYTDEAGTLLYQIVRFVHPTTGKKSIRPRKPDGSYGIQGIRRVPYRLPELIAAVAAGWTIYVTEGEKDADLINGLESGAEFFATTVPFGAETHWRPEFTPFFAGAKVVIVADRDEVGRRHALDVRHHLSAVAKSVGVVHAAGHLHDAGDHVAAGHGLADFVPMPEPGASDATHASAVVPLSSVVATYPEYDAEAAIRRMGLHLWWGPPGNYKTYLALLMALTMTQAEPGAPLFGVEAFRIRRRWKRVLWLGDEESAGELRARAEIIARGHGLRPPKGDEIMFADASGGETFLNIADIPNLADLVNPDAVIVDPLANLTPSTDARGNAIKVDLDNTHALTVTCRPLRRLCKQRGIAVFLSHHPNAAGDRERGPTAYRGSADVVMRVALDGPALVLDFGKNRDAKKEKIHLEPVWTGHRETADRPLTLTLLPTTAPTQPSEDGLPDTAIKILAAIRAAGPLEQEDVFDAAPGLHRSTYFRNLGLLRERKLVESLPDGRWVATSKKARKDANVEEL